GYSVFFFSSRRRHTRFSRDWSSDVCSSDLRLHLSIERNAVRSRLEAIGRGARGSTGPPAGGGRRAVAGAFRGARAAALPGEPGRSEERRVGKECGTRGVEAEGNVAWTAERG